jgi:transposase
MKAWLLKEIFKLFWEQISKEKARSMIEEWCMIVKGTANEHLVRVMKMVRKHMENILGYYDFSISTGPLEGLNNKIKVMKRQAYGFRDMEFFKLRILTIHETKYQLTGV